MPPREPRIDRKFTKVKLADQAATLDANIERWETELYGNELNLAILKDKPEALIADEAAHAAAIAATESNVAQLEHSIKFAIAERASVGRKLDGDKSAKGS